jgi:hypothetical protein
MEVALVSAALIGAGIAWNRIHQSQPSQLSKETNEIQATKIVNEPNASNIQTSNYVKANANPQVTQISSGTLSGRRDHSNFVDSPSPYEQQMSRVYGPKEGTKREVKSELDPTTRQDNVFVRSNTSYQSKFYNDLQKPTKMHNVNPIPTTTGTASQLVGPGINSGTKLVGDHGLHYGMVRMRPEITHPTFREQKGGIIPGKNLIDTRPADINLLKHAASGFTLGESGFEKNSSNNPEPLKFHAISKEYLTSAPGRAVVTGNSGAGGMRLEPRKDNTNRGIDNSYIGISTIAGLEAPDSRQAYTNNPNLATQRETTNQFLGIAKGEGVSRAGHQQVIGNFTIPDTTRNTTEVTKASHVSNLINPGQSAGILHNNQDMQTTQRQTLAALDVINMNPQFPTNPSDIGDNTRKVSRLPNEYRPGVAGLSAVPNIGGQKNQFQSFSQGKLSTKTQRESLENENYLGPLKSVGVNASMSYQDILSSERYSNKDLPQIGFAPPASPPSGTSIETAGIGHFDSRPELPNTTRIDGGGIANQAFSNFHVINKQLDVNPNKSSYVNQRLDPQILDALSKNKLQIN